jgi:hypothetical protein
VPTIGAARRIQALRAIGWTPTAIAQRAGIAERTPYAVLVNSHIEVDTHLRIAAVYEELRDQDPTWYGILPAIALRTRRDAARRQWAVPAAWTDIDTDESPNRRTRWPRFAKPHQGDRSKIVIQDTAELAANGATREEVAARIGIEWDSIAQAHRRANTALPLALRGDEPEDDTDDAAA